MGDMVEEITSMAIATAAALHFAIYSSVLGVPRYMPRPGSSTTPVYSPLILLSLSQSLYGGHYLGITLCVHFDRLVTIDTGDMLQLSNRTTGIHSNTNAT